jgi:hypothetical protein
MVKSGLIIGAVAFILVLGGTLISPLCAPCVGILLGLAAGYLAGVFDKPALSADCTKKGASAGAIAGGISILGSLIGAVINAAVIAPSGNAQINDLLGLPPSDPATIWGAQLGAACCLGLLNVALGAGLGAAGGALWYQMTGKKQQSPASETPQY